MVDSLQEGIARNVNGCESSNGRPPPKRIAPTPNPPPPPPERVGMVATRRGVAVDASANQISASYGGGPGGPGSVVSVYWNHHHPSLTGSKLNPLCDA